MVGYYSLSTFIGDLLSDLRHRQVYINFLLRWTGKLKLVLIPHAVNDSLGNNLYCLGLLNHLIDNTTQSLLNVLK